MGNNILFLSASEIARLIKERKITSEKTVSKFLEQIKRYNKKYNAVVTLNPNAIDEAKMADKELSNGNLLGKLHGVPITIKDNYKTKGLRSTSAYLPLKDNIPDRDAEIVKLLRAEGAIIIGKTNLSVLAMDMQSNNPIFGKTNNPWDITRTSGGSSGGCATALAAGMTPLSFGNDLAGSIRLPAAYCGVYGFKPSFGIVPLDIQMDPKEKTNGLKTLAVSGPLARNVEDLKLGFEIIAQNTKTDSTSIPIIKNGHELESKELNIAWTDEFGGVPVDKEIQEAIQKYIEKLNKAGIKTTKAIPALDFYQAWKTWGSFVGMQGGFNTPNFIKWLGLPFTKGVLKKVPMHQNIVKPTSVEKFMVARNIQDKMITTMNNFLNEYNAFICPVSAVTAFPHHTPTKSFGNFSIYNTPLKVNGKSIHYYMATQAYTTPFTLTENPVISMPIALTKDSLPIGIQVVGKRYSGHRLLDIGKELSKHVGEVNYPLKNEKLY